MTDGDAIVVGDGYAPLAARAAGGSGREVAAEAGIERAEAVAHSRPVSQAKERRQRDHQLGQAQPYRRPDRRHRAGIYNQML